MEHVLLAVNRNMENDQPSGIEAPREVIDALVTLTRAGLLRWYGQSEVKTEIAFGLYGRELSHTFCPADPEGEGILMNVTDDQVASLLTAFKEEFVERRHALNAAMALCKKKIKQLKEEIAVRQELQQLGL